MNHVFKIIWNKVNQCWVAVSELSKSVGKSSQTDKRKALNVIIGAAVLAGVSTTAMAETNVVLNNDGNIVGGTEVSAVAGVGTTGDSVVLGKKAKSEATESIVIGNNVTNKARWSITLGNNATSQSGYGVTLGDRASSGTGTNSVAIGLMAKTSNEKVGGNSQTAVGVASYADGEGASAFGATANATGSLATAVGRNSKALALSASAFGDSASASAWGATALGRGASARADNSIAVGSEAVTEGRESTALGRRSYAGAQSAAALGTGANASGVVSTAVGNGAKASALGASALGNTADASGRGSMAFGYASKASGVDALASGSNANASSMNAVAVGKDSNSSAVNSIALGTSSNVSGVSAVVIGTQAKGTHENSVTLGSYSSSAANNFDPTAKALSSFDDKATGTTVNYNGTSSTQKGAVSVGDGSLVRQIQNVGAGRITATSNDAVNGSQLYQAYYNAGFNIQNNGTETSRINTHGKVNFANGTNTEVVVEDGDNAAKITVNLKDDITVNNVTANNLTVGPVTINKDGINAGDKKITNVSNGTISADSKDAVNGSQLYAAKNELNTNITKAAAAAKTEVKAGTNVEVTSETGANNQTIYTVNAKDTSASVEAASDAVTVTVGEKTEVKNGISVTTVTNYKVDLSQKTKDEIKNAGGRGFNVTASASEGTVVNEVAEETVQSTATKMDKLTLDAGKNIKLTHKKGKVLSVAVSDTPTFKNVTTKGDLNVGGTVHAHGGLDVHNNRIVNVADPKDPTDAVNKRYVDNAVKNINNNINRLDNKIDHVDRKLRAGIAGATAISFLQRPNEAGKSLVSVGVGGYRNENALAVGYGRNSDNNKISIKVGASINTRSDVNWGGSIGYQW
ncbi:YadA-like family protein [Haemophilus sp.]|jgi:autotransporter adhesin|uniref:YadA-like family protein n=1 Tax=Haemophilus sp. TaxID=740 RepID=UPI0025C5BB02|nr:YadA-like family protein [Haemophilus sp.]MDU4701238.1 YadA-like family protein [Haemophilus parainfluenzae]MDU4783374.1 YadA-like family protein [Haemophilus parainfluenzae]MDU7654845.1 YadA-like family protein [Haemophilus parainfluenzae]